MGVGITWPKVSLGVVATFFAFAGRSVAQTTTLPGRLTVRPHEIATGTRTAQAGEHTLDSLANYLVYVPQQAVGTKRMPLVVVLHGGGLSSREQLDRHRELAEKYGMILLLPNAVSPGRWDVLYGSGIQRDPNAPLLVRAMPNDPDVKNVDAAMKQVLQKYAIDLGKIAVVGMSDGGGYSLFLGRNNLDIFSRIVALSPSAIYVGAGPQNTRTQLLISGGIAEGGYLQMAFVAGRQAQQDGYAVKQVLVLRPHEQRNEEYDYILNWLKESWASPSTATRSTPRAADSVPLLTAATLTQMTTFWSRLMKEPDSIRIIARMAHQKEVTVRVGDQQASLMMVDMPALAAKYPSVAAALKAAGLTARQAEAYRIALISAKASQVVGTIAGTADATSVLGKNIAFLAAYPAELQALDATGIWTTP